MPSVPARAPQGRRLQRTDETHAQAHARTQHLRAAERSGSNETHAQAHLRTRYYFHGLTPLGERASEREFDDVGGWGYWTWTTSRLNTLAPGQYGHVLVQRNGGTDRYLHYDHVGNVIAESSTAGVFTAQHEQDAFGRPVLSSAAGGWSHNALHMTTKDWDAATGLFYFFQRWSNVDASLFKSTAPMVRWLEHPYNAVGGGPFYEVDPSGEMVLPRKVPFYSAGSVYAAPGAILANALHQLSKLRHLTGGAATKVVGQFKVTTIGGNAAILVDSRTGWLKGSYGGGKAIYGVKTGIGIAAGSGILIGLGGVFVLDSYNALADAAAGEHDNEIAESYWSSCHASCSNTSSTGVEYASCMAACGGPWF